MIKKLWLHTMTVIIMLGLSVSLTACTSSQNPTKAPEKSPESSPTLSALQSDDQEVSQDKGVYKNLVINDFPIEDAEYLVETDQQVSYLLLSSDIIIYALKMPDSDYYPELSTENGQITLNWTKSGKSVFKVDMVEGSSEAYINDSNEPIAIGVSPKIVNNKLYIPINLILQSLKMEETYDKELDVTYLHFQQDFSKEALVGLWSDSEANPFTEFEKALDGSGNLASFATGYQFNTDGTYQALLIGVSGFDDKLVYLKGKYEILGNTLIYHDIQETLYEGNPLELVHENEVLDYPTYEFIDYYDKEENLININGFLLYRVKP